MYETLNFLCFISTYAQILTQIAMLQMYAALGYMRQYCELMVEIGEWDKAVMAAPAVSVAYWQQLAAKRAQARLLPLGRV